VAGQGLTRRRRSDAEARAAWDSFTAARNARLERDRGLDERRKKMKHGTLRRGVTRRVLCAYSHYADLEAREREYTARTSDEEVAKARLKAEARKRRHLPAAPLRRSPGAAD
jgi:hypothetical protein